MMHLLYVALGGAIGASLRYLLGIASVRVIGPSAFPWATFVANITGGLMMGLLVGWMAARVSGGEGLRLFLAVGVLGGFTTFSSFSIEALRLIETKSYALAMGYIGGSVIVSIAAVFAGLMIARKTFAL